MKEDFIISLSKRLRQPLPGEEAQRQMLPELSDTLRFHYTSREHAREGSVLILFYQKSGLWHFPLIKRPVYAGVHSGQVAFPGGKRDPEDNDRIVTALRETEEEIGVARAKVEVIGALTELFIPVSNFRVLPVVGVMHEVPAFVPDAQEVDGVLEAPVEDLLHPANIKSRPITTSQRITLQAPYFALCGEVVWGATAMMLSELAMVLKEINR
jgi:8-oxo-dGTP pyrophosphatase MutT (NUDIX family)